MNIKRIISGMVVVAISFVSLCAQISIGAKSEPVEGALLSLKQNDNSGENSTMGLLLPRVNLENRDELYPMFKPLDPLYTENEKMLHTGLIVYNLTKDFAADLCPGPYCWNGSRWDRLWDPCSFLDFMCESMGTTSYVVSEGISFTAPNHVFYRSDIEIDITTEQSFSYGNGLSLIVTPQKIEKKPDGIFVFYVDCDGTTPPGTYDLSLSSLNNILGIKTTACEISVEINENTFNIDCDDIKIPATINTPISTTVQLPYSVLNVPYSVPAGDISNRVNGIIASIESPQKLDKNTGYITVTLTGTPTQVENTLIPITIGNSHCEIEVEVANAISLDCTGVSTTGTINTPMTATVLIPYTVESTPYIVPAGFLGERVNGVVAVITSQQVLNTKSGNIEVTLAGIPSSSTDFEVPLKIGESSCSVTVEMSAPISILCSDIYTTGYIGIDMSSTSATSTVRIPCTLSGVDSYDLVAAEIGTSGGITAFVEAQRLTSSSGVIVKFKGTPEAVLDEEPFPVKIAGNTCSIHLSTFDPPAYCSDGLAARGFVFQQGAKWYVVTIDKSSTADAAVQTIECDSEEDALRHPDALQYCGSQTTDRCIPLFDRDGDYQGVIFKVDASTRIAQSTTVLRCWQNFKVSSGSLIESISNPTGYLGAVNVSNGKGYLGITTQTATMTTNALR